MVDTVVWNPGGKKHSSLPGSPWNNGVVESFHRRRRYECLVRHDFGSLLELPCVHRGFSCGTQQLSPAFFPGVSHPCGVR
ncbi:integrase core domain-containing protein [Corynebacterium choanae]|uniref:integrase core domain-containing protein n=1 Tax=Corynebacterium choanae TaxID=1862358 RepID=UPI000F516889